jgi:membrane-associated phospholipid phosphatase
MASDLGMISPIHRISSDIWGAMGVTNFSEVYANLSPNAVAAVPSLHSAYPMLFFMFFVKLFGWRKVWWAAIYPISMWIGVTYLGEHYVIDAILGAAYAVVAYVLTMGFFAWKAKRQFDVAKKVQIVQAWTMVHVRRLVIGEEQPK